MGTEIEQSEPDWKPIAALPFEERRFFFRWADGETREMDGYDPDAWSEDGHRVERPVEFAEI